MPMKVKEALNQAPPDQDIRQLLESNKDTAYHTSEIHEIIKKPKSQTYSALRRLLSDPTSGVTNVRHGRGLVWYYDPDTIEEPQEEE